MDIIRPTRRSFLTGLAAAALAAPAIVRAGSLMPVRTPITLRSPIVDRIEAHFIVTGIECNRFGAHVSLAELFYSNGRGENFGHALSRQDAKNLAVNRLVDVAYSETVGFRAARPFVRSVSTQASFDCAPEIAALLQVGDAVKIPVFEG